jgi:type VI secretion system protein ImpK
LPQQFQGFIRNELPLWLYFALLALIGLIIFGTYRLFLGNQIDRFLGL